MLTEQTNHDNLFVSPIVYDRYQILESNVFRGRFYIYDHKKDDIVRAKDNSTVYYEDTKSADEQLEVLMASVNGVTKSPRAPKIVTPKVKTEKESKVGTEVTETKKPRVSAHGTIINLIKTTEMTDQEIFDLVAPQFPGSSICTLYGVKWRRKRIAEGVF